MTPLLRTDGPIHGRVPRTDTTIQSSTTRYQAPAEPESEDNWRLRGVCANSGDMDRWFPMGNTGPWLRQIEEAKKACLTCPVLEKCAELLAHMERELGVNSVSGIWAGTAEDDRMSEKRKQQRAAAKVRYDEKRKAAA
ncbi:transcription factor WhiB [Catenulispora acidiphila DSM 44928]|uniref:Transcription factor WhiB n=1 Tax=Catenulispora acidiphila (strain DSM 44928 / JCM 14897 / NBRC 102108 / NRRL B-24433 / ID139908) TaxID=479433 RepID=C7Q4F4_CATAD|nr:WhiB family transcriptional regulator [Catenulispora acidiphila]ACU71923.1 transcription factor WhiB [Catenulispora acidiphila DSM 44928]